MSLSEEQRAHNMIIFQSLELISNFPLDGLNCGYTLNNSSFGFIITVLGPPYIYTIRKMLI